jgi:hypothetical protein
MLYEKRLLTIGRLWIIDLGHPVSGTCTFGFEYHGPCSSLLFIAHTLLSIT